jgi:NAD(P)-dependent dehydrogenase (short-subunit alcohol dehydrogenase family)
MSKIIVVTGASAGVGRACVRAFAQRGYDVALLTRRQEGLARRQPRCARSGPGPRWRSSTSPTTPAVEAAASHVEDELGPIDVWVNNAMASVFGSFLGVRPRDGGHLRWLRQRLPSNVEAPGAARHRNDRAGGVDARLPRHRLQAAYCADKHAIQGLCDSLRTELHHGGSHVHVAMVQLPALNTPS